MALSVSLLVHAKHRSQLLDDTGAAFRNDPWNQSPSSREMQNADDFSFQEIRQQQTSIMQGDHLGHYLWLPPHPPTMMIWDIIFGCPPSPHY